MSAENRTFNFTAITTRQQEYTLYLASLPASKLIELCAGLRPSTAHEMETTARQYDSPEDAQKLVKALAEPHFAKQLLALQRETYDKDEPYQRILDEARARDIAAYLREDDTMLPNGIILATRDDVETTINGSNGKNKVVEISLEWNSLAEAFPLNIIDGQHRIEGLRILVRDYPETFADFEVPVTLLVDQPFYVQAELFAVVNGRQKPVSRSRIYDLLGYLPMGDNKTRERAYLGEMAVHRFCHHVVKALNQAEKSPWRNRIKMRGSGPGIVTQAAMVDHLALYLRPKKERPNANTLPVLYPFYKDSDLVGLAKFLIIYFAGIRRAWPDFWNTDEALKTSLFGKTNGVAVMFAVMHNLILVSGGNQNLSLEMVTQYWGKVSPEIIAEPPKGGSKGYQVEVTRKVMQQMLGDSCTQILSEGFKSLREQLLGIGGLIR